MGSGVRGEQRVSEALERLRREVARLLRRSPPGLEPDLWQRAQRECRELVQRDVAQQEPGASWRARSDREIVLPPSSLLFDYQQQLVDALRSWWAGRGSGSAPRAMVALPTGAGKTRTVMYVLLDAFRQRVLARVLWVAPMAELLDQAAECVQYLRQRMESSRELVLRFGSSHSTLADTETAVLHFATVQAAARRPKHMLRRTVPELVVFDEAHQAQARTYRAFLAEARSVASAGLLGVSATPGRSDEDETKDLAWFFGHNLLIPPSLASDPVGRLQEEGILAQLVFHTISLPAHAELVRLSAHTDVSNKVLLEEPTRLWAAGQTAVERARTGQVIVFGANVAHCYALAGVVRALGMEAEVVTYRTKPERRQAALQRFRRGELRVLVNRSLLATGYDCPAVTDVVLAAPVRSPILWEQIMGRVLRGPRVGGTEVGHVWELDDHRALHGDVLSYERYRGEAW
ncbi:MAG: DEAD/DEAH box helicase [Candidatus Dadabacteria bacterium]|nr:MAG: DEAD/DEAH box helicase [Candidatus Dadabacteria bacterium]